MSMSRSYKLSANVIEAVCILHTNGSVYPSLVQTKRHPIFPYFFHTNWKVSVFHSYEPKSIFQEYRCTHRFSINYYAVHFFGNSLF